MIRNTFGVGVYVPELTRGLPSGDHIIVKCSN